MLHPHEINPELDAIRARSLQLRVAPDFESLAADIIRQSFLYESVLHHVKKFSR